MKLVRGYFYCLLVLTVFCFLGCSRISKNGIEETGVIHFSIDDVNPGFRDLTYNEKKYKSFFDQSFFKYLKKLHDKYDAKVTIYCFMVFYGIQKLSQEEL